MHVCSSVIYTDRRPTLRLLHRTQNFSIHSSIAIATPSLLCFPLPPSLLVSTESAPNTSISRELAVASLELRKGDGGMCEGAAKADTHPSHQCDTDSSSSLTGKQPGSPSKEDPGSRLLEFAAANDVQSFRKSVEEHGGLSSVDCVGNWYVRQNGSRRMALEQRTPAMVAASYGSMDVLKYIVKAYVACGGDLNRACGSDGTTALHCAVAGCSAFAVDAAKMLVDSGADINVVDANGRTVADIISVSYRSGDEKRAALEEVLSMNRKKASSWENAAAAAAAEEEEEAEGSYFSDYFHGCNLQSSVLACEAAAGESSAVSSAYGGGSASSSSSSPKSPQVATGSNKLLADGSEKTREYPNDPSLPDIKNSIYSTDEFRMYTFKVRPCSRAYSHDWTECPFVHPGENARRRDPRRYHYSCVPCPDFRKGACRRGDSCEYAHGVFECWLHPAQYRTRLCKDGTDCNRRVCFFAHTSEELRSLYVSTGSALPSPRPSTCLDKSSAVMSPPLTPGSPLMMPPFSPSYSVQGCLGTPPMSPQSSSANALSGSLSLSQPPNMPALQLPGASLQTSRLRAALNARDVQQLNDSLVFSDFEGEMLGSLSAQSLSTQARLNAAVAAAASVNNINGGMPPPSSRAGGKYGSRNLSLLTVATSNLEEMFGASSEGVVSSPRSLGHDSALLSQLEAVAAAAQMQSPGSPYANQVSVQLQTLQAHHQAALEAQLVQSPSNKSAAFSLGPLSRMSHVQSNSNKMLDAGGGEKKQCLKEAPALSPSLAAARAVFAQRDSKHSYSSRDLGASLLWSDWGSPTGKPEWSIQGDDLCKLRKSASMGVRATDEPDLSWVQTLVKEGPMDMDLRKESPRSNMDGGGGSNLQREAAAAAATTTDGPSLLGSWIDKLHLDRIMA